VQTGLSMFSGDGGLGSPLSREPRTGRKSRGIRCRAAMAAAHGGIHHSQPSNAPIPRRQSTSPTEVPKECGAPVVPRPTIRDPRRGHHSILPISLVI